MIASDSSSLIALFRGEPGSDVDQLARAMSVGTLVLPPPVLTELLSDASGGGVIQAQIRNITLLEIREGYWERAGLARRLLHRHRHRAKVADALIAQACIDNDVALITRDADFRHFAKHCGLKLA